MANPWLSRGCRDLAWAAKMRKKIFFFSPN